MNIATHFRRKFHNLFYPVRGYILMLHRVVPDGVPLVQPDLEIPLSRLEAILSDYRHQGYNFVSMDDMCESLQCTTCRNKYICVTIDDGYDDTFSLALPLFKQMNIPFTVYVTTGFLDGNIPMWWYSGSSFHLSSNQLLALAAEPLCTIGAHTVSHPHLSDLSPDEQREEIRLSKQTLERLLASEVHHFSYPHGSASTATAAIVRSVGFRSAVVSWGGGVRRDANPMFLPRLDVLK